MSAPMVRACLDGSKTQTRRGLYLPRLAEDGVVPNKFSIYHQRNAQGVEVACDPPALTLDDHIGRWWAINPLVKLKPGDRLWVKETWRTYYADLWRSINGPDSWAANPWVIVLSFTAERRNIEEIDRG